MKNVARIVLAMIIFFLATGLTLANAQNRDTTPCASVSTGADSQSICAVQRKLDHTNRRVTRLQSQVKSFNQKVGSDEKKVEGLAQAQTEDHALLNATITETESNASRLSALESDLKGLSANVTNVIIIVGALLLLGGVYLWSWLRGLRRSVKAEIETVKAEMETLEGKLMAREIIIINPSLEFLRSQWKDSEGKPEFERVIHFTERLTADPGRGHDLSGDVSGYTAVFEDDDVDKKYPIIRHNGGPVIRLDKVAAHAAKILGSTKPEDPSIE